MLYVGLISPKKLAELMREETRDLIKVPKGKAKVPVLPRNEKRKVLRTAVKPKRTGRDRKKVPVSRQGWDE